MAAYDTVHLDRIVEYCRAKRTNEVSLSDVVSLAEITAESLQAFFRTMDRSVYRELRDIADYIAGMKREIGALQVHDLKESRIPAAGLELDAIVKATEKATNTIMGVAEDIMAADASDHDAYKAFIDERILIVFEACSFQDITGQRIAKVVETLKAIESRVSRFADATRVRDVQGYATEEEAQRAARKERLMLHGPVLDGEGVSQADIDNMIGAVTKAPPLAPAAPPPVAKAPAPAPAPKPAAPAAAPEKTTAQSAQDEIDKLFD